MQKYLPDHRNETHLKVGRLVSIIMSIIILLMFLGMGIYFLKPISSYISEKFYNITGKVFKKSPEKILASIRKDVLPSIVQVGCLDEKEDVEAMIGSGIFYYENGDKTKPMVQTNAHVVLASDGKYHGCNIYFPREDGSFYKSVYMGGEAFVYHDVVSNINGVKVNGMDLADIRLEKPLKDLEGKDFAFPPDAPDVFEKTGKLCSVNKPIEIGEKIYLIGYPNTGGNSITLTVGVVSGFTDENPGIIKVSANSNHGSSGGIAIGQDNGCYYGVLYAGTSDSGPNLSLVISSGYIDDFLKNTTDEKIQIFPQAQSYEDFLTLKVNISDITLPFPESWQVATFTNARESLTTYSITSPFENALDIFREGIIVEVTKIKNQKTVDDRIKLMQDSIQEIKATDVEEGNVKFPNGIEAYQVRFTDNETKIYGAEASILNTIFVYKNKMYLITSLTGDEKTLKKYSNIYKMMLKNIEFR